MKNYLVYLTRIWENLDLKLKRREASGIFQIKALDLKDWCLLSLKIKRECHNILTILKRKHFDDSMMEEETMKAQVQLSNDQKYAEESGHVIECRDGRLDKIKPSTNSQYFEYKHFYQFIHRISRLVIRFRFFFFCHNFVNFLVVVVYIKKQKRNSFLKKVSLLLWALSRLNA